MYHISKYTQSAQAPWILSASAECDTSLLLCAVAADFIVYEIENSFSNLILIFLRSLSCGYGV
jgi:hypothetical protein